MIGVFLILLALPAFADEPFNLTAPSSFGFDLSVDSYHTTSAGLTLDLGLQNGSRFLAGASRSRSQDELDSYRPRGLMLGWATDPIDIWSFAVIYNYYGIPREIFSNAITLSTTYIGLSYRLTLSPRLRKIRAQITSNGRTADFEINNPGVSAEFEWDISKKWIWGIYVEGNHYSEEMAPFQNNIDRIMALAPNVGEMTSTYVKGAFATELVYQLSKIWFGLEVGGSESVISQTKYRTGSLKGGWRISKDVEMALVLGRTQAVEAHFDPNRFATFSITFLWP